MITSQPHRHSHKFSLSLRTNTALIVYVIKAVLYRILAALVVVSILEVYSRA